METAMAIVTEARVRYEDDLFAWTQEQAGLLRAHADTCPYSPDDVLDEDHLPTEDL
jgi:hypothetical protein